VSDEMKLFLSWSGKLSLEIATILRDWVPQVIQNVEPYVSSEDIDKGARWSSHIAQELEESFFGIVCVTRENVNAPWINFEAGALSKTIDSSKVCPFLFDLKTSEIKEGPLLQFQFTIFKKDDFKKLMLSLNNSLKDKTLPESVFEKSFNKWWPELEESLNKLKNTGYESNEQSKTNDKNLDNEILEEILNLARSQQKILNSPNELLPQNYLRHVFNRYFRSSSESHISPAALQDLVEYSDIAFTQIDNLEKESSSEDIEILRQALKKVMRASRYLSRNIRITPFQKEQMNLFSKDE